METVTITKAEYIQLVSDALFHGVDRKLNNTQVSISHQFGKYHDFPLSYVPSRQL